MKPAALRIEVTSIGGRDFGILVDGVHWCFARHEPRGMHGASYTLLYHAQSEPITERVGRGCGPSDVILWSDKHWLSAQGYHGASAKQRAKQDGKYKTIQERIAETAARLIKKKLIVSPDELTRRREAKAAIEARRREEFEAEDRTRLNAKANKVVDKAFGRGQSALDRRTRDRLGLLIIEAMEWARSNT